MPKTLSVRLFGGLEVRCGSKAVLDFDYEKVRALFAYLMIEPPSPHNRDVLAGTFWPDQPEDLARQSLRQALAHLRSALGDDRSANGFFLAGRTCVQRNPRAVIETDVAAFEACLHPASDRDDDIQRFERAAALYRGELLRGLSLVDTEAFSEWLQIKRQEYQSQAVAALDRLVRHYEQRGDFEDGCRYAQQLVSVEPWREDAHRRLMLMLARSGKRAAALKQYELCRQHLREALDVDPETETERLFRRIQQMGAGRSGLPATLTRFIGRQPELKLLMDFLSDPSRRLITITGLGGVGKSRLAIETGGRMAAESCRRFLHGVVFVPLAGVQTQDHLVAAMAQNLGLSLSAGQPAQRQVIGFLQDKELLLILDNFEHLINRPSLELLGAILNSAPEVKLLVTSRSALGLQGEQLLPLEGLPVPAVSHSTAGFQRDVTADGTAAHFLVSAVRRRRPDFKPSREDLPNVLRICQTVEGMPLALELAAACAERLPLEEIHSQIKRSLDLLETTAPNMPERHRSVRAVFDASWRQLNDGEQRILARLSVFSGSFSREAARDVTGADERVLARLAGHSLLHRTPDRQRCHLHELLRQFSSERLDAAETDRTLDQHSDFFSRRLRALEPDLRGDAEEAALRRIDEDFDNIRRAWLRAVDHGEIERINEAATALHHYVRRRALFEEGVSLFADVDRATQTHREGAAKHVRARLLAFQGEILAETGQRDVAVERLRESLRLIESPALAGVDLRREQALALFRLAWLTDDATKARPLHEQSLSLYRQVGDSSQVASGLAALGYLWKSAGELEKAEACFEEGLKLRRTLKTPGLAAEVSFHLGELRARQGRHEESLRVFREGLKLARRADDRTRELRGLASMSTAYIHVGQFDQSEALLRQAIRLQQQLGCSSQMIEATALLGWSLVHQGRYPEAGKCADQILAQVPRGDRHPGRGLASMLLGAGSLAEGQPESAHDLLMTAKENLSVGWQVDWQGRRCVAQALLGCALCHLQQLEAARTELASALHTALQVRSLIAAFYLLPAAAFLWLKRGDACRARQVFSLAWAEPAVCNSPWFHQVLGGAFQNAGMLHAGKAPRTIIKPHGSVQRVWDMAERQHRELSQDAHRP